MEKLFLLFFVIINFPSAVWSQTTADDIDYQFWHETQVSVPLVKTEDDSGKSTDKLLLFLNGNLRFGENISRLSDKRIGFGFDYKYNKYVSFTPSYLYIAQKAANGDRQYESRLRFAVNLGKSWKRFSLDDRNLVEYRLRNNNANSARYRNRIRFVYPVKKDEKEIFAPFTANEIFYDFRAKTFSRNEFSVGLNRKLNSNLSADFFYLWQTNKSGSPKNVNVFGVNLKIRID